MLVNFLLTINLVHSQLVISSLLIHFQFNHGSHGQIWAMCGQSWATHGDKASKKASLNYVPKQYKQRQDLQLNLIYSTLILGTFFYHIYIYIFFGFILAIKSCCFTHVMFLFLFFLFCDLDLKFRHAFVSSWFRKSCRLGYFFNHYRCVTIVETFQCKLRRLESIKGNQIEQK